MTDEPFCGVPDMHLDLDVMLLLNFKIGDLQFRDSLLRDGDLAYCVIVDLVAGSLQVLPSRHMGPNEVGELIEAVARAEESGSSRLDIDAFGRDAIHLPTLYRVERPEYYATADEAQIRATTLLDFGIDEYSYGRVTGAKGSRNDG